MTLDTQTRYPDPGVASGDDMADDNEILARVRRIETRLTQYLIAQGVPTQSQKPRFDRARGRLLLPSPHSSLAECTKAIPIGWDRPVEVYVGSDFVVTLTGSGNSVR